MVKDVKGAPPAGDRVTIYSNHPAFALVNRMYVLEQKLFQAEANAKALLESLDVAAAVCRKWEDKFKKLKAEK